MQTDSLRQYEHHLVWSDIDKNVPTSAGMMFIEL